MATSPNEVPGDGEGGGGPEMVTDSSGTFVATNEDKVYDDPEWEWAAADSLLEGGQ